MSTENPTPESNGMLPLAVATLSLGVAAGLVGIFASSEYRPLMIAGFVLFSAGAFLCYLAVHARHTLTGWTRTFAALGLFVPFFTCCFAGLLVPRVSAVRTAAARTQTYAHFVQITTLIHAYNDVHGHLPPSAIKDRDGRPLLSWRVAILEMGQKELYDRFNLDEPWDSEHNLKLLDQMPRVYESLYFVEPDEKYHTRIQVVVGPGTAFDDAAFPISFEDSFPDGLDATILLVEAARPVPWTKPEDVAYDPDGPFPELGGISARSTSFFGPERGRMALVITAARNISFLEFPQDEENLRAGFVRNDGKRWRP